MYQQKKQWCVLHAKLFKLFVGGALLLAVSPAYAAGDNYSGTDSTHSSLIVHQNGVLLQVQLSMKPVKLLLVPMW